MHRNEPFEEKLERLTKELEKQLAESARLQLAIRSGVERLGREV